MLVQLKKYTRGSRHDASRAPAAAAVLGLIGRVVVVVGRGGDGSGGGGVVVDPFPTR